MLRFLSCIESDTPSRGVGRLSLVRTMAALAAALPFLFTVGFGQIQSAQAGRNHVVSATGSDSVSGGALSSELMELRREGHEAMYNLDSATAVAKFEEIRRRAPGPPRRALYLATAPSLHQLNITTP